MNISVKFSLFGLHHCMLINSAELKCVNKNPIKLFLKTTNKIDLNRSLPECKLLRGDQGLSRFA
jgi:hypothetical protein